MITGATSGLGLEFARIFAGKGSDLVITARTEKNLNAVAKDLESKYGVQVHSIALDLSDPKAPDKLFEFTQRQKLFVEVLVNNAGIGVHGKFAENAIDRESELLELNIISLTKLCHLYLRPMLTAGRGKILNIASLAAFQAGTYFATYFASKAYVLLLTEALALEYRKTGVTVSALCPPPSRTGFFKRAGMPETSRVLRMSMHHAPKVAKAGYRGLMAGKTVILPSIRSRFIGTGYRVFPRSVISRIADSLIAIASRG